MFRISNIFQARSRKPRRPSLSQIDVLEDRCLLTTFIVDSLGDQDNGDDPGISLREAVRRANEIPGENTITFDLNPVDEFGNPTSSHIQLNSELLLTDDVQIVGPASMSHSGGTTIVVNSGVTAILESVGIGGGADYTGLGGAIRNAGTLTINNSSLGGRAADGGSIYNTGTLRIEDTTIRGGFSLRGAGIFVAGGLVEIFNSTIDTITAAETEGGGIYVDAGVVMLTSSTIADNRTFGTAGGIFINDTNSPDVTLHNTIVAGNLDSGGDVSVPADVVGTLNPASSYNLIGDSGTSGGLTHGVNNNIVGNNGVGTLLFEDVFSKPYTARDVEPLIANSPARNAGNNALAVGIDGNPLTTDQRGGARINGGTVDIGAYEYVPYQDIINFNSQTGRVTLQTSNGTEISERDLDIPLSTNVTWDFHTGDVNGDGIDDLIGRQQETGQWWAVLMKPVTIGHPSNFPQGPVGEQPELVPLGTWAPDAQAGWQHVQVGDINNDGNADIVGMTSTGQWWGAVSDGTRFNNQYLGQWNATGWAKINFADVNNDGNDDLLGFHAPTGQWWVGLSNGTAFTTTYAGRWQQDAGWSNFLSGDFDGDGNEDLIAQTAAGYWYIASLTASQKLISTFAGRSTTNHSAGLPAVGDFDGDGRSDLLLQDAAGNLYVKLATDTGMTNTQFWGTKPTEATNDMQLGDFNGDGRTDIAYFGMTNLAMETRLSTGAMFLEDDFGFNFLPLNAQRFTGEFGD